jgi:hypothetical protein
MQFEWCLLVAQMVVNLSKFPHSLVGKFERYKPIHYVDSSQPHNILYAKSFLAKEDDALKKAELISRHMFHTYVMNMNKSNKSAILDFTVLLHNVTENKSKQIMTTINGPESKEQNFLMGNLICSNKNLGKWGVVKGLR